MTGKKEIALESRIVAGERLYSPSAGRNRDPIREVFLKHMPREGRILEVGSGTGEHVVHLAAALPGISFLPGDPDEASRASIAAWTAHLGLANIAAPHAIDVAQRGWTKDAPAGLDGILSINMIHIAPFEAAEGLIAGAGALLAKGGKLFLYGPFARKGAHTAPSNAEFDVSLKARNRLWGVRDLEREIVPCAIRASLEFETAVEMPANNFSVVFRKL